MTLLISGCQNESEVSVYDVKIAKQNQPRANSNNFYSWKAPSNWHFFEMLSPFQDALFFAPSTNDVDMQNDHTTAQVSVSFIENVEFDASSNTERWQRQLSANINEVSVEKVLISTNLGDWQFFKLKHESQAMYVAVHESFEGSLFFKMVGQASTVQEHAEAFINFIESVKEKDV